MVNVADRATRVGVVRHHDTVIGILKNTRGKLDRWRAGGLN